MISGLRIFSTVSLVLIGLRGAVSGKVTSYRGKLLAIVRAGCEPGEAKLIVSADGYADAEFVITVQ